MDGRNSYSKTDPDATFMHMKDDHMNNSQLKPGYNVQIGVESEYVTGVGIFQDRSDNTTLIPFLNDMESNLGNKYQNIIADSGYESEENYLYLEEKNQKYYINHRHMKSGRRKVLKMILVSVKTWFMIKIKMNIPATMENNLDQLESSIGLQQVATVQKLLYTNVKTATIVHINQNVQKHEATERCKYQKYL
ncbi:DDE family transposase [Thermohydrogenium kirishiense]|nr:DDE family transposase [Thermohydrogenium kirishiense]